jgi:sugar O-acyltransferase (sialic acid O-acetyltransferase NeuD family)
MNSRNKLLIIGASGHGRVVADIAMKMNRWQEIAFLDDDENIQSPMLIEIIGKSNDAFSYINDYDIFVAIGNNQTRKKIQTQLEMAGANISTLIHPSAIFGEKVEVGVGTVVMAGVVINCCSSIGEGCIVNTGAVIDHDNVIEDYVHISPGVHLAGTVKVGKETWLGIGSVVSNNINICNGCIIGAGAVVVRDITVPGTYVGVPSRRINNDKDSNIGK